MQVFINGEYTFQNTRKVLNVKF